MPTELLGLIAGNGKFPILFAKKARAKNYRVIAAGINGDTSMFLKFFVDKAAFFNVGELKKMFKYFKNEGIKQVIMAGQVNPGNLFEKNIPLDEVISQMKEHYDKDYDFISKEIKDSIPDYPIIAREYK